MPSTSCCRQLPAALGPLETTSTFTSSSCSSSSLLPPPSPTRGRRFRRVLYPASQSRRPPMREDPDQARRWLLILSALVFLQIYTEETHTCTGWVTYSDTSTIYIQYLYVIDFGTWFLFSWDVVLKNVFVIFVIFSLVLSFQLQGVPTA